MIQLNFLIVFLHNLEDGSRLVSYAYLYTTYLNFVDFSFQIYLLSPLSIYV